MALFLASRSLTQRSHMLRGVMSVSTRACTARLSPTYVQTREFHFDSWKQKIQMIKENKDFWVSDLNNQALKYGLFGVSVGTPTTWVVSLISWMNSLGLPWWGAITGVCIGFRAILLPFSIKATKQGQKMQEIQPELNKLVERARLSQSMGMASDAQQIRNEMMDIYKQNGVSPMGPMVGSLIQLPVVLSCFMGIRRLCEAVPAVAEGGVLWFPNLAIPDPLYVLPVLAGLSTLFMTELGADGMNSNGQVGTKYMMRGMSLFTVFIAARMPAGLCLYWIVNSVFAGAQTLCVNKTARETFKRWMTFKKKEAAIPPPPPVSAMPYTRAHPQQMKMKMNGNLHQNQPRDQSHIQMEDMKNDQYKELIQGVKEDVLKNVKNVEN